MRRLSWWNSWKKKKLERGGYTTVIAVTFMYVCMVGGTWFFGIHLNLLAVGAYIALAGDECVRAVFMFLRWQSGKWRTKGFIKEKTVENH